MLEKNVEGYYWIVKLIVSDSKTGQKIFCGAGGVHQLRAS